MKHENKSRAERLYEKEEDSKSVIGIIGGIFAIIIGIGFFFFSKDAVTPEFDGSGIIVGVGILCIISGVICIISGIIRLKR